MTTSTDFVFVISHTYGIKKGYINKNSKKHTKNSIDSIESVKNKEKVELIIV